MPPPSLANERPPQVYAAIAAVTAALSQEGIAKNRENRDQRFQFRGIDDIYNSLSGLLAQNRLCIIPRVLSRFESQRHTKSGAMLNVSVVDVEYDLVSAVDGSRHTARVVGEAQDSGDKSTNKAMSAAYKYLAFQVFCIPTEGEDNDADARSIDATAPAIAAHTNCLRAGMTDAGINALLKHYRVNDLAELPSAALQQLASRLPNPDAVERFNLLGEHGDELPATYQTQP